MSTERSVERANVQEQISATGGSALNRYSGIAVGRKGLLPFLRYELMCCFLSPMPGAVGYLLRSKGLPKLFGSAGRGLVIGRSVCLRHPGRIRVGSKVIIDDNSILDAKGDPADLQGITLGDRVFLGRGTSLICKGGTIRIGDGTQISGNCMLMSESSLSIGANVLVAGMTYIVAGGNHGMDRIDTPIMQQPCISKGGVSIGDNCWLGANVTVLDGVIVGRDSVIGAGAVVTQSVPEFAIAVGVPAKVVKLRKPHEGVSGEAGA